MPEPQPQPLSPQEIAEAWALCEAATGGSYEVTAPGFEMVPMFRNANAAAETEKGTFAHARTLLPRALRTIADRDAEAARLRGLLRRARPCVKMASSFEYDIWDTVNRPVVMPMPGYQEPPPKIIGRHGCEEEKALLAEIDAELAREVTESDG